MPRPCTLKHTTVQIHVTSKLVGNPTILVPGSTYSSLKPAAAKTEASDDFVVVVEFGNAKRPVRKDVVFVERVTVRVAPLGVVLVRVMVGVRRVRRVTL